MENFFAQFDNLFKPINERLAGVSRSDIVRYVAIYLLVVGVLSVCGGLALVTGGALGGIGGVVGGVALQAGDAGLTAQEAAEANQAMAALGAVSGLAILWGILTLVTAPLLIISAIGLFQRKNWGRNLAVIAFSLNAILSILGLITGNGIINILWIVISGYLAYFFSRDTELKAQFS